MIGNKEGSLDASLYFHIPFCTRKCPYCHFYVLPDLPDLKEQLLSSLSLEWTLQVPKLKGRRIVSIYFGGGTPFLFGPKAIGQVMNWIHSCGLEIAEGCEVTLEANPENVTFSLMQDFKEAGINRISLGVQSLDDSSLNTLERTHNAKTALSAIDNTFKAGFSNISIDLMYDLPYQTLDSWKKTLSKVDSLPISHLSLYNLTFEPKTVFFKNQKILKPHLPSPESSLQMLNYAVNHLCDAGFTRYEISAFAKDGLYSRHNTGYWLGRPFLGFGPSAFSYWDKKRFSNVSNLKVYSEKLLKNCQAVDFEEELPYPDNVNELLAIALRLLEGVELKHFQTTHGPLPQKTLSALEFLENKGWLEKRSSRIQLTEPGRLFYDTLASEII